MTIFDNHNALWGNLEKREYVIALVHFFNRPRDAETASAALFDIFMDMSLSKQLTKLMEKDDNRDVRPMVAEHLSYHIHSSIGDELDKILALDSLHILLEIIDIQQHAA